MNNNNIEMTIYLICFITNTPFGCHKIFKKLPETPGRQKKLQTVQAICSGLSIGEVIRLVNLNL